MAAVRRHLADLLDVRGIGPAQARQFGAETLQVIKSNL